MNVVFGLGLLLGFGGIFGHMLVAPFAQPRLHVFVLSAEIPSDLWPESLPSVRPAPAAAMLLPLMRSWTEATRLPEPQTLAGLATGQTLDELFHIAERAKIHPGDMVLGVVQSQLAVIDNQLYLVDRLNPRDPQHGRIPFEKFVETFRASTTGTRLLCLDAGQLSADLRSGMAINNFGEPLRQIVEKTGDPRLWVLVSHQPGQCSQVADGHAPTVFLHALARGLREANQNSDQHISIGELVRFVRREIAGWEHKTGGAVPEQTPWLLRGNGTWTAQQLETMLAPIARPAMTTQSAMVAAVDAAKNTPKPEMPAAEASHAATAMVKPVTSMTIPELLNTAWELRDELKQPAANTSPLQLRPCDFAPYRWNRLLAELVQAETLWRHQPESFPPRIGVLLQVRVNELRALAGSNDATGSEWLKSLHQLQPRPAGEITTALSLSMFEQWQSWTHGPTDERALAERNTLRGLLTATDSQPFLQWRETKPSAHHSELQFAWQLSSSSRSEWPPIQQALRVRSQAEELACHPIAVHWFTENLTRADQLRWYGERKLSDPVRSDDSVTAYQTLSEATAIYHEIAAATVRVVTARRLESELLMALPHWMALSRNPSLGTRSSLSTELTTLIPDLEEFIELLANARTDDCGRIEQLRHALQRRRDRIETLLFPEVLFEPFRLIEKSSGELRTLAGALLETPLPTASQRQILQTWLAGSPIPQAIVTADVPTVDDFLVVTLEPDHELEMRFARLLQPLRWQANSQPETTGRWAFAPMKSDLTSNWCQAYVALPGELRKHLAEPAGSVTSAAIAWRHTFLLVDPRDEIPVNVERHISALFLDDMKRVIHWQCEQATRAQSDAPAQETARLQEQIDQLGALLTNAFDASRMTAAKQSVRVSGPESLDLATVPEQMLRLTVQNPQRVATRVRYIVEYDSDLLEIETTSQHCQLLSKVSRADNHIWPYDAAHGTEPMSVLPVEGQDDLRLKVRGRLSEGPTRLVVHVVTDCSTVRQDIQVRLPQRPLARVQVKASSNERLIVANQQLRPFGNRSTSYHFSVQGMRRENGPLDITAYRVTTPTVPWLTATTLPTMELQRWLSQTPGLQEMATVPGMNVNPDSAVPLRFPAVKPGANLAWDASGGFLIVMTDTKNQLSTWQHLPCAPLRPAAYVDSEVHYDESREMLRIAVRPRDELEIPAEGILVRSRIVKHTGQPGLVPGRWESAPAHSVTGMLQPHEREFTLNVPWRRESDHGVVLIDVDDWPRAFVFSIEPDGVRPSDEFAVEILDPQRRSAVRAPAATIPVTIAVTIPARFTTDENLIEVGVDRNGDRRLDGEPTQRLPTDRQTGVILESIDATGAWTMKTSVRDWQVSVPTAGLSNQWGTVLARIARGPHESWSEGIAVAFDKDGPRLSQITVSDNGQLAPGQPVRITALADDQGLSGVASVSAGIDPTGLGIISANTVMVAAKVDAEETWSAILPTEKLSPGAYFVVLQATDYAGNVGPVSVVPIRCLTTEELAAKVATSLQGQVQYAGEAIGDAEVRLSLVPPKDAAPDAIKPNTLTTKTNRAGRFTFESVAPGQYTLIATGTVRGFRYESRTKVTVAPGKDSAPVQLVFGQKVR